MQMTYGTWHLEDPSGAVELDLSQAKFHTGLYAENCFVLAEGWYDDQVLHVLALGKCALSHPAYKL
jgi:DNA polymerase epsilon subunit 2